MPHKRPATKADIQLFKSFGKLYQSEEVLTQAAEEGKLELIESSFTDPGEDYSKLVLAGQTVGYSSGY